MPALDPALVFSALLGTSPTFLIVVLAWMHSNARAGDTQRNLNHRIDDLRGEIKDSIKSEAALIRAEFRRVEEVMDARLKHLEEREH